jgi:predicted MFS family arabinose efflux permease
MGLKPYGMEEAESNHVETAGHPASSKGITLGTAIRTLPLWLVMLLYLLVNVCVQVVLVHIVNYATDLGYTPLVAATILSVIGIGGVLGRLAMGSISDRTGTVNAVIITTALLAVSMILLVFSRQLWLLYLFAVLFSFAYGGEVPQMPQLSSHFYGLRAVMALTGAISAATRAGGALGSWLGGEIFDRTQSYLVAFIVTAIASLLALGVSLWLKRAKAAGS